MGARFTNTDATNAGQALFPSPECPEGTIDGTVTYSWEAVSIRDWPLEVGGRTNSIDLNTDLGCFGLVNWGRLPPYQGTTNFKRITGIAKDSTGTVLGGATIKVYRTADNVCELTTTSNADGAYEVGVPDTAARYIVAYKAGSPDVAGTTVNTLAGA